MRFREIVRSTSFMDHAIAVTDVEDRRALFAERCASRSVLHVGCCDVPVFDPDTNLHIFLARHTDRIDGLDVSREGIEVLRRHVDGDYFTTHRDVTSDYDLVLAPDVLEHTPNAHEFLAGIFTIRARQYLISAPHIGWFHEVRRTGEIFHERVHPDHKAWYSPYTLLNTLAPFYDKETDDLEVFLFGGGASVAVCVTKPFTPKPDGPRRRSVALFARPEKALERSAELCAEGDEPQALRLLADARTTNDDPRLVHAQLRLLLALGHKMDVLRQGVAFLRWHPDDVECLLCCADAVEALGDATQAAVWRAAAKART